MQIYRDLQEGRDGGAWELVSEYTDDGAWKVQESCGHPPDLVLLNGGSVYLRNDDVIEARYKWASCREIEPEPSL
jgi:hypothetical protein